MDLQRVCREFLSRWRNGDDLLVEVFLRENDLLADPLMLCELVRCEIQVRQARGEKPQADGYLRRFPEVAEQVRQMIRMEHLPDEGAGRTGDVRSAAAEEIVAGRLPSRVGEYVILQPLADDPTGTGGLAESELVPDRRVIVRCAPGRDAPVAGPGGSEQADFLRGVVRRLESGRTSDGRRYTVEEVVSGPTLIEHCDQQRLSIRERCRLFVQTCRILENAHQRGWLHGDLRPSLIRVLPGKSGLDIRVAGVGPGGPVTAGWWRHSPDLWVDADACAALIDYVAPEQLATTGAAPDVRSDVYSLGVLLYELLTGGTPVSDGPDSRSGRDRLLVPVGIDHSRRPGLRVLWDDVQATQAAERRGSRPEKLARQLSGELDAVVLRCLEEHRDRRYRFVGELADDVQRYLDGGSVTACEDSARYRWRKLLQRRWSTLAGVLLLVVLLLVAGVHTETLQLRQTHHRLRQLEWSEYAGRIALAQYAWQEGSSQEARSWLRQTPEQLRGWEYRFLETQFSREGGHRTFAGHDGEVHAVACSPDGLRLVSGGADEQVLVHDTASGEMLWRLKAGRARVTSVAVSPDGNYCLAGGVDTRIRVWDLGSGELLRTLTGHVGGVYGVAFAPSGRLVASGSHDGSVRSWDITTGEQLETRDGHRGTVNSVCFSPDGERLISGSADNTVRIRKLGESGSDTVLRGHRDSVTGVACSPDGQRLASASYDGTLKIWSLGDDQPPMSLSGNGSVPFCVAFSPDGTRLVSGHQDRSIRVWEVSTGELLSRFRGHIGRVTSVQFTGDGQHLISGSADGRLKLWDANRHQDGPGLTVHAGTVSHVALSPDGAHLAVAADDGAVHLRDTGTDTSRLILTGHEHSVTDICFSPDGRLLASTAGDFQGPGEVRVWQTDDGREVVCYQRHQHHVSCVAFDPDGEYVATGDGHFSQPGEIRIWQTATQEDQCVLAGHESGVTSVVFAPQGRFLVSGSRDGTARVWDCQSAAEVCVFDGHQDVVTSVAVSPDGHWVVSGSRDGSARVWELHSGRELRKLEGHEGWLTSVVFTRDGERVATGSRDRTVRLWDPVSGQQTLVLKEHRDEILDLAFSADGSLLMSGSEDGQVRIRKSHHGE